MATNSGIGRILRPAARSVLRRFYGAKAWHRSLNYAAYAPSIQQTINLFEGEWSSQLPFANTVSGSVELFSDSRIQWLIDKVGGVDGMNVLELGPLEGGHTTMLEKAGAASIMAVEGSREAFLKCLVVKELASLRRARFVFGDIDAALFESQERFDLIVASGVLYHLHDPLLTLQNMMARSDRIFIWSHFVPENTRVATAFTGDVRVRREKSDQLTYYTRSYLGAEKTAGFSGGAHQQAVWLNRDEVVSLMHRHGFSVDIAFEEVDRPNGPAACLLALRNPSQSATEIQRSPR